MNHVQLTVWLNRRSRADLVHLAHRCSVASTGNKAALVEKLAKAVASDPKRLAWLTGLLLRRAALAAPKEELQRIVKRLELPLRGTKEDLADALYLAGTFDHEYIVETIESQALRRFVRGEEIAVQAHDPASATREEVNHAVWTWACASDDLAVLDRRVRQGEVLAVMPWRFAARRPLRAVARACAKVDLGVVRAANVHEAADAATELAAAVDRAALVVIDASLRGPTAGFAAGLCAARGVRPLLLASDRGDHAYGGFGWPVVTYARGLGAMEALASSLAAPMQAAADAQRAA